MAHMLSLPVFISRHQGPDVPLVLKRTCLIFIRGSPCKQRRKLRFPKLSGTMPNVLSLQNPNATRYAP